MILEGKMGTFPDSRHAAALTLPPIPLQTIVVNWSEGS
jgi:hypothetical protein